MKIYEMMISYIGRLISQPVDELNRSQRSLRYVIDLIRHCGRELHQDRAGQMAAALTYHTLFSLLPTVVLMLVVLHMFVGETEQQQFRETTVNWILQWLEYEEESPAPTLVDPDTIISQDPDGSQPINSGKLEFEHSRIALSQNIQTYIDKLEQVNFKSIGVVGVLLFIYGATGLLATIERSFNMIYGVHQSRPWYLRLPLYYTVITLGPLVLLAGQWLQSRFLDLIQAGAWTNWLTGSMVVLSPLLTTWLVLTLMYILLPNTTVSWRPAVIGSFVASAGWVVGVAMFSTYVAGAAAATLYGALALLPLFLLWMYLTWLFVLFGLEITYTLQAMSGKQFKHMDKSELHDSATDPHILLPVMTIVAQAFQEGGPASLQDVAGKLSLPIQTIEKLGDQLCSAGLVHYTENPKDNSRQLRLSLPPEKITVWRILEIGRENVRQYHMSHLPGLEILKQVHQNEQQSLANVHLIDLLDSD